MKIAIITHDFSGFSGSVIVALEVANYFSARGNDVVVRAERHSNALRPYLNHKVEIAEHRIDIADFDLVWSQHGHFCLNTSDLGRLKNWNGHFVSVHLSGSTPAETYHYPFASRYALCRVFNCSASMENLEKDAPAVGRSLNLRNAAPEEFHRPPRALVKKLKRLLVVSNHVPKELLDAMVIAEQHGVKVSHIGVAGNFRLIRPEDIYEADAVISIGKTVQYSLCSARPVYCYDHFGGPGWLTPENFKMAEHHNFSGRCHPKKKSSQEIFQELTDGFEASEASVASNWKEYSGRYHLNSFMDELNSVLGGNMFHTQSCLEEIDAMRGALMHVDWIWRDVFSKDDVENARRQAENAQRQAENAQRQVEVAQERMFETQEILTNNLEKPWLPLKDAIGRRLSYLAAAIVEPLSKRRAMRFRKSAMKRNPRRYKAPERPS